LELKNDRATWGKKRLHNIENGDYERKVYSDKVASELLCNVAWVGQFWE